MSGGRYAAMLNNLGGTAVLEMSILADDLCRSEIGLMISHIVGPASMMTALDTHGISPSSAGMNMQSVDFGRRSTMSAFGKRAYEVERPEWGALRTGRFED